MNRSFSKIRHIQEVNKKLEERRLSLLTEQVDKVDISKYAGSGTNPMDDSDIEMEKIKVTKYQDEVEKKKMSPSDPIYQKIKDFFEGKFNIKVLYVFEPVNKTKNPNTYAVGLPSPTTNEKYKILEFNYLDIDNDPKKIIDSFEKFKRFVDLTQKPDKTYGT